MSAALQKREPGLLDTLKSFFGLKNPAPVIKRSAAPALPYTESQQRELENLMMELLKKRELIASGKLQMLGFEKIKAKLGDSWPLLQAAVYRLAYEVIRSHVSPGDLFVRYREDTFILVFARATLDEGAMRAKRIALEIGKRISELAPEGFNIIQVDARVGEIETKKLAGKTLAGAMDILAATAQEDAGVRIQAVQAAAAQRAAAAAMPPKCNYHPLWDNKGHALSHYLCVLEENIASPAVERDLDMLRAAKAELRRMQEKGSTAALIVPVRHGTLFNTDSSQRYQMLYRDIPEGQRKNLVFMIVDYMEGLPEATAFWFIPALKTACRQVFAEMPLRGKAGLSALKSKGIDGIVAHVPQEVDEAVVLGYLRTFGDQGVLAGFPQLGVLNLPSLSLATSASCMGFTLMGGAAIHAPASAPDKSHKFRYAELFSGTN